MAHFVKVSLTLNEKNEKAFDVESNGDGFVSFSYGHDNWKVKRSVGQISAFIQKVKAQNASTAFSTLKMEKHGFMASAELVLNEIFNLYGEEVWTIGFLISFFDDAPSQSVVNAIQLRRMHEMVYELQDKSLEMESKHSVLESKYAELLDLLTDLKASVNKKESRDEEEDEREDDFSIPSGVGPMTRTSQVIPHSQPRSSAVSVGLQKNPNRLSFLSAVTTDSAVTAGTGTEISGSYVDTDQNDFSDEEQALIEASFVNWEREEAAEYDDDAASITREIGSTPVQVPPKRIAPVSPDSSQFKTLSPLFPSVSDQDAAALLGASALSPSLDSVTSPAGLSSSGEDGEDSKQSAIELNEAVREEVLSMPSSKNLPADLFPSPEKAARYSEALADIMRALQPHETQIHYRSSAVGFLKKQIRISSAANGFDVGLHAIRCSLPDDPIKMSVIQSKNHMANWHTVLTDRLSLVSERAGGSHLMYPDEEDAVQTALLENLFDDCAPLIPHFISSVASSKQNANYQVHCVIDSLEVEIVSNARSDLCMLAFLEDVAQLVGKDNLFKRSLLLIRAWWVYETAFYVGCVIKHYLSDFSLSIMVCAIFNQYHSQIGSPLQALCLFLTEYSGYDGATHAITLQGLVAFQSPHSNHPLLVAPKPEHLISQALIDKYWEAFNIAAVSADVQEAENEAAAAKTAALAAAAAAALAAEADGTAPSDTEVLAAVPGVSINSNDYYNTLQSSIVLENKDEIVADCIKGIAAHNLFYFERLTFSIVHPFTNINVIDKLSQRRLVRLAKAFHIGATNFAVVLRHAEEESEALKGQNCNSLLKSFFPTVMTRFGEQWRPDAINNSTAISERYYIDFPNRFTPTPRDVFAISAARLWDLILFGNLMLESVLSETALLKLGTEILAIKGPLPVGEIGKILAEMSSIANLSLRLKEKFGGLKKFLEHFPKAFVIFNDHPFNPNVLLRHSLTADQLELIDKGIFPHQLLLKAKKGANAAKKKSKSLSIPSPSVDIMHMRTTAATGKNGMVYQNGMSAAAAQNAKFQQQMRYPSNISNQAMGLKMMGGGVGAVGTGKAVSPTSVMNGGGPYGQHYVSGGKLNSLLPNTSSSAAYGGNSINGPQHQVLQQNRRFPSQQDFQSLPQPPLQAQSQRFPPSSNHGIGAVGNVSANMQSANSSNGLVELGFLSAGRDLLNEERHSLSNNSYFAISSALKFSPDSSSSSSDLVLPGESNNAMLSSLRTNSVQLPRTQSGGDLRPGTVLSHSTSPVGMGGDNRHLLVAPTVRTVSSSESLLSPNILTTQMDPFASFFENKQQHNAPFQYGSPGSNGLSISSSNNSSNSSIYQSINEIQSMTGPNPQYSPHAMHQPLQRSVPPHQQQQQQQQQYQQHGYGQY